MQTSSPSERIGEFGTLTNHDEYALYFDQLHLAFQRLLRCYRVVAAESHETAVVHDFFQRLLQDVELLRVKYAYPEDAERRLRIDLTHSGFPNHAEIAMLQTDLLARDDKLRNLPAANLLKRMLVDQLIERHEDPPQLLAQLAQRAYLERLESGKLFLPYTPGTIKPLGEVEKGRSYAYSWGCYDFATNRPYIQLMSFEQNAGAEPLEQLGKSYEEFEAVLSSEGSRAPDLAILAMAIDSGLESIHPKILKRVCLGPVYSMAIFDGLGRDSLVDDERLLLDLLEQHSRRDDDCILFLSDEVVISKRQEISRSIFAPAGRVREIFFIPESDPECYRRRVTVVHHACLLPHAVAQHLDADAIAAFPQLGGKLLTYDQAGEIHGI